MASQHEFKSITLWVRGIKSDAPLSFWVERYKYRLKFPEKILKDDVKPERWNYIFLEPGVKQQIDFVTPIDDVYTYIIAHAEFNYDKQTPHSIEWMFAVVDKGESGQKD